MRAVNKDVPIIIVATKMDLIKKAKDSQLHRNSEVINERSVRRLVNETGARAILYCSANSYHQVKDVFACALSHSGHSIRPIAALSKKYIMNHTSLHFQPDA